ncbi:hypothetical protein HPB47_002588, partial [Ixodes persulcatus]
HILQRGAQGPCTTYGIQDHSCLPRGLKGHFEAPKQPAGKQGSTGDAGSTQTPPSIHARPPADRQPRASGSFSQDAERARRSTSLEVARLVREQQGPPAALST